MEQLTAATNQVRVRTTEPVRLRELLAGTATVADGPDGTLAVSGAAVEDIARTALDNGVLVLELTPQHPSLEDAYYALTRGEVEYTTDTVTPGRAAA
jgi:ABC-2 type transport system ATP-binding protein